MAGIDGMTVRQDPARRESDGLKAAKSARDSDRKAGRCVFISVRYADDFVVLVSGTQEDPIAEIRFGGIPAPDGRREMLGVEIGTSEAEPILDGGPAQADSPRPAPGQARRLRHPRRHQGGRHQGAVRDVAEVPRVHFMRNVLAHAGKRRPMRRLSLHSHRLPQRRPKPPVPERTLILRGNE